MPYGVPFCAPPAGCFFRSRSGQVCFVAWDVLERKMFCPGPGRCPFGKAKGSGLRKRGPLGRRYAARSAPPPDHDAGTASLCAQKAPPG